MPNTRDTDYDQKSCQIMASSISEIVRYSLNEDFKKSTLDLLNVSSPKEAEKEIYKKLMTIIKDCHSDVKRKNFSNKDVLGKEDEQQETNAQENNSQTNLKDNLFSTIIGKRNWLQISTKQYKESMKRKKLGFCSQPENYKSNFDYEETRLHSFSLPYNDCSPSTSTSFATGSSQDMSNSFSNMYDDETNFCKKKFKELLNKDATKYLKMNLKSKKYTF